MAGKIYGVALGPGDPELITIKAFNVLNHIDKIYYPGSVSSEGEKNSHALKILEPLGVTQGKETRGVFIQMSFDRSRTEELYSEVFEEMVKDYQEGKDIAIVSEGDIAFYSTFGYLLSRIKEAGMEVEMIPGIPAFIQAGSVGKFPITLQSDRLVVLSQVKDVEELEFYINQFESVVVMKLSTVKDTVVDYLAKGKYSFFYAERLGTTEEFTTSNIEELANRRIPYFSLLIINGHI